MPWNNNIYTKKYINTKLSMEETPNWHFSLRRRNPAWSIWARTSFSLIASLSSFLPIITIMSKYGRTLVTFWRMLSMQLCNIPGALIDVLMISLTGDPWPLIFRDHGRDRDYRLVRYQSDHRNGRWRCGTYISVHELNPWMDSVLQDSGSWSIVASN